MSVRVRFAPSPTGFLHLGGARTALYNWLYARHRKGVFVLRIEDTDEARSTEDSLNAILSGLTWLGLDWDEGPGSQNAHGAGGPFGPYFQMQRADFYKHHLNQLLEKGRAYPCFCTREHLDQMRKRAMFLKRPPKYDGRCRRLSPEERKKKLDRGQSHVYRFARPSEGEVQFHDLVKGLVRFESERLDDFVLVKSSGIPTFMFAGAVDDHLMKITHVIRGDDHLSNTPRQLQLFDAFEWDNQPIFAHISMIHGPDGSRLSKRHGATSISEFRGQGFLPEAMLNYLALLGWSTSDSQQIFEAKDHFAELVEKFELERAQKSPALFDLEKLKWLDGVFIRKLSEGELLQRVWPHLVEAGLVPNQAADSLKSYVRSALLLEQEKLVSLSDSPHLIEFFLKEEISIEPEAEQNVLKKEGALDILRGISRQFEDASSFTAASTEKICRRYADEKGVKAGRVFHPVRVAVSGRTKGPSLFHMLEILGKERVMKRMKIVLASRSLSAEADPTSLKTRDSSV